MILGRVEPGEGGSPVGAGAALKQPKRPPPPALVAPGVALDFSTWRTGGAYAFDAKGTWRQP